MSITAKILTYEQVEELHGNGLTKLPYPVIRSKGHQQLFFVAISHTNNLNNVQIEPLRRLWQQFWELTEGKDRIVLTEGGTRPYIENEKTAMDKYGEQGLVACWAGKAGIQIATPEPPQYSEAKDLLKTYSQDEIMYYYFARQIPQWHRTNPRPEFKHYINDVLQRYKVMLGWSFDFSLGHMENVHSKLYGTSFDPEDRDFFNKQANPTINKTVTQKVARACSHARDVAIASAIAKLWQEGKSIFSAYGSQHVYMLEPVIKLL